MTGDPVRRLGTALEPVAAQVYFSPECHEAYRSLGFGPSPGKAGSVALPDGAAYFCSRGSVLGQVSGEVIAATFAVFKPAAVVRAVKRGWQLTDARTICAARTAGGRAQLDRILGPQPQRLDEARVLLERATSQLRPEGHPLYAGLIGLGLPGDPLGDVWRLADVLREYRGDSHTAAWTGAGLDACEIGLLTELYWGLPSRSYVRTRAWSNADLDEAEERLAERGLLKDGALTEHGRTVREEIEVTTDVQCRPILKALGDDLETLVALLDPWGAAIRAAGGYPASVPHELARTARSDNR